MSTDPNAKPSGKDKPLSGAISKSAGEEKPGIAQGGTTPPALTGASGPVQFEFEDAPAEAPKKKSYAPPPAGGAAAAAGSAAPASAPARGRAAEPAPAGEEDVDPDVKPGSRKDLWICPHCGAGNRPGRPNCRTCNKSPDEPVVKPWFKQPLTLGGIAGGVLLLVLLLVLVKGGPDLSLKPADPANIDSLVRHGKHGATHDLGGGLSFQGRKRFAVCGYCIGAAANAAVPNSFDCVLLLGSDAGSNAGDSKATFPSGGGDVQVSSNSPYVVLHLVTDGTFNLRRPVTGVLSLTGEEGEMDGLSQGMNVYSVLVDGENP